MDATAPSARSSTPSVSSSTLQLLTPPSSEQLCSSSSKQLCGSTRLVLAELGLARLSKFAHALDLSKLRAGAISAPELRALGLSTHEIDRLLAWARGQASDSPLFKLRYGQGSPHKQSVLAPARSRLSLIHI